MKQDFFHIKDGEVEYLKVKTFEDTGLVKHCYTTRCGGVSKSPYDSLNLKFVEGDDKENIIKNFEIICDKLNIEVDSVVLGDQRHTDNVEVITLDNVNKIRTIGTNLNEVDGLITNIPNIALGTNSADCLLILLLDPIKKVIGSVHSGWQGTLKQIGVKAVLKMQDEFGCNPEDILIALGPVIGPCHFEVLDDVYSQFKFVFGDKVTDFIVKNGEKYNIDLWNVNIHMLKDVGILEENISVCGECTYCNKDLYYSYRREGAKSGRLCGMISLK